MPETWAAEICAASMFLRKHVGNQMAVPRWLHGLQELGGFEAWARGGVPVEVAGGVAHAVDAGVAGEVLGNRVLQRCMVACRQRGASPQAAANHVQRRLTVHLHTIHASACTQCIIAY